MIFRQNVVAVRCRFAVLLAVLLASGLACAEEGEVLKVICASRAETPPTIDGTLDDPCWQKAEIRGDFTGPGSGLPLSRRTTMRALYDQDNLYFGFEVFWDDVELLKKGIAAIKEKYPVIQEGVWMKEWQYENVYGMELFIDPGAGGRNYYQLLFNAAGQRIGNYKGLLDNFNIQPEVKGVIRGNCWSVELRYSAKNLKAGQEWGLNVCRNDDTYYGIWKQVHGAYGNPKLFGRLVIGGYQEWWNAVGGKEAMARLEAMKGEADRYSKMDASFNAMLRDTASEMAAMGKWAAECPPTSRENFERLYGRYATCHDKYERMLAYHETLRLLTKPR